MFTRTISTTMPSIKTITISSKRVLFHPKFNENNIYCYIPYFIQYLNVVANLE